MLNPRRVLTRAQILDHVWDYDFGGDARVLETYISYLRKKLDLHGPPLIHTVRGVGYALRRRAHDRVAARAAGRRRARARRRGHAARRRRHLRRAAHVPARPRRHAAAGARLPALAHADRRGPTATGSRPAATAARRPARRRRRAVRHLRPAARQHGQVLDSELPRPATTPAPSPTLPGHIAVGSADRRHARRRLPRARPATRATGPTIVAAIPLTATDQTLNRLLLVEGS